MDINSNHALPVSPIPASTPVSPPPPPSPPTTLPSPADQPAEARFTHLSSLLVEWDADAEARFESKKTGKALGPKTGLHRLDTALGAHLEPGLHHIHGNAGVGKTAFALQIAASCGCPCLYVTCEMRALELLRRITARLSGTFLDRFKNGELTPKQSSDYVQDAVRFVPSLDILDATEAPASPSQIWGLADTFSPKPPAPPHYLIVIDSLNSWVEGAYPGLTEYEALNMALADLRKIAAHLKCPILIINERNRASMKEGGLNAGAGSRKIEYGAESVWDLAREKDAKEDANGEVDVALKIEKNRNGRIGKPMTLKFHGALQRYKETPF